MMGESTPEAQYEQRRYNNGVMVIGEVGGNLDHPKYMDLQAM